jgi:hypothetical protein
LSRVFGTWPTALLLANRKRVIIEGPVCDSSKVIGWHLRNMNNETITSPIHISSFAFNSSILWDPERWGRTSSVKDTSQVNILSFTHHDLLSKLLFAQNQLLIPIYLRFINLLSNLNKENANKCLGALFKTLK